MGDQNGEHVHWYDDGRGMREVILDGDLRKSVIYADVKAGVIVAHDLPLKTSDGETVDIHAEWGQVRVIYCGGYARSNQTFRMGEGPIL
ncbi:hypothetical protein SAMN03159444_01408 [Pseudomonas sp. NFACC02]|nr:hypothetical protein SAMN03159444_01408 [Pseudomonas sp. NFACC02]